MQLTNVLRAPKKLPGEYHNLPKRFVDRHVQFIQFRAPRLPQYRQKIYRTKPVDSAYYDQWRPWQQEFERLNSLLVKTTKVYVEPIKHFPVYRGDRVEVLIGPEKGKQGIVNYIVRERNWVFVGGVKLGRTLVNQTNSYGTIMAREQPLLLNVEVKLVDPSDLLPCDIEWRYDDDGNRVRVSTRTERIIPIPEMAYETIDYKTPDVYKEQDKDTKADDVNKKTFVPAVKTFEMDICEQMGIVDERVPYPTFWY